MASDSRQQKPLDRNVAVAAFVVLTVGFIAVIVSFTVMHWLSTDFDSRTASFGDIRRGLSATSTGGLAGAYFQWLGWVLLVLATALVVAASIPSRSQNAWRSFGVLLALVGVAATVGAVNDLGVAYKLVSGGFWLAIAGFVVIGAGALIPSRPVVAYLPNYGMPTDQQKFSQPHQPRPAAMPGMPLGSIAPPQSTYSQPASAPSPAELPGTLVGAGWMTDPARRYELRYWDGSRWTENVSSNGRPGIDPL